MHNKNDKPHEVEVDKDLRAQGVALLMESRKQKQMPLYAQHQLEDSPGNSKLLAVFRELCATVYAFPVDDIESAAEDTPRFIAGPYMKGIKDGIQQNARNLVAKTLAAAVETKLDALMKTMESGEDISLPEKLKLMQGASEKMTAQIDKAVEEVVDSTLANLAVVLSVAHLIGLCNGKCVSDTVHVELSGADQRMKNLCTEAAKHCEDGKGQFNYPFLPEPMASRVVELLVEAQARHTEAQKTRDPAAYLGCVMGNDSAYSDVKVSVYHAKRNEQPKQNT